MNNAIWLSAALLGCGVFGTAWADNYTVKITVKATVNLAPCQINNGQLMDIDFGSSIVTTDVANGTYEKPVNYTLDCGNADPTKMLKMRISGTGATFDSKVLKTSISALGVKLKANGTDFPLNTDLAFASAAARPALTALLVQQADARLPVGTFTAAATMTVDYQ